MQHKVQAKDNISLRRKRNVTNFDFKLWVKVKKKIKHTWRTTLHLHYKCLMLCHCSLTSA